MDKLDQLQAAVLAFRDARNWKQHHTHKDIILGLVCEVAELAEHVKFVKAEDWETYLKENRSDISDEIADIFYWILIISKDWNIDLAEAIKQKLPKNEIKYPV